MNIKEFINVWYNKHIHDRDPTLNEWRCRIWLTLFYICTKGDKFVVDDAYPLNENTDIIRMNRLDFAIQLELFVNYPKVIIRRPGDKNEIIDNLEDFVILLYWYS